MTQEKQTNQSPLTDYLLTLLVVCAVIISFQNAAILRDGKRTIEFKIEKIDSLYSLDNTPVMAGRSCRWSRIAVRDTLSGRMSC